MKGKIVRFIPFITLCCIILYSWFEFLTQEYVAGWRHYVTLIIVTINAILYFKNFKLATLLTGIILVFATFNLLPIYKSIETSFLYIGELTIPWIDYWSFLILIAYFILNFNLLINCYLDLKDARKVKSVEKHSADQLK